MAQTTDESKRQSTSSSTFTIDQFNSTTKLADNDIKFPIGSAETIIEEKQYNPHEHRKIEHPNTFFGALVHLIKSSLGTGILAMPYAFRSSGIVMGLVGTLFTGFICTHTIQMLVSASQEICSRTRIPMLGFSETAEAVFRFGPKIFQPWASIAKLFVELALSLTYYVGGAVYIVFISVSIQQLVIYYYPEANGWTQEWYMLGLMLPLMVCCQVRELKHMVPFSLIANITMIVAFAVTLYYMFSGLSGGLAKLHDRKIFTDITELPLFFSTVLFAMEGIGTMLPIENSLQKPHFLGCLGILNIAMSLVTILYTTIGIFGYLRFGDQVHASVTFDLPESEIPAQVAKACISVAVFFTFMLQFYVPVDITWRKMAPRIHPKRHWFAESALRSVLVLCVTVIAMCVPNLGPIIELVGSLFFSTLGLFIPAVIDIVVKWDGQLGRLQWILYKDLLIIALSLFAMFSGSYFAIRNMISVDMSHN